MSGPDLIFIRSHRFGPVEAALAAQLEPVFGAGNVALCLDESRGAVDTGRWPKSSLTRGRVQDTIGAPPPADWGWRMGDLCHIAVAEDFGPRRRQWLIESDVHIPAGREAEIFARLSAIDADFMACNLAPKKVKQMAAGVRLALPTADWGCIFAFNRLDGAHVPALRDTRRAIARALPGSGLQTPNDEAVVANLGHAAGWTMVDLFQAAPEMFARNWFDTNPPMLREACDVNRRHPRVSHPVLSYDAIHARLGAAGADGHPQRYKPARLGRILSALDEERRQTLLALIERDPTPADTHPGKDLDD